MVVRGEVWWWFGQGRTRHLEHAPRRYKGHEAPCLLPYAYGERRDPGKPEADGEEVVHACVGHVSQRRRLNGATSG